jgi:hypothetical protein
MSAFASDRPKAAIPLSASSRPLRPFPANAAVLESGRHAGEALPATMGGFQPYGNAQK